MLHTANIPLFQTIITELMLSNFAFVYPHLIYGIELYGNTCPSYLDKLGKLNNKLLRILQGKDRRSPIVELYLTYNTLPVLQLHDLQILLFVHKCLHHRTALPLLFSNYFIMNKVVHDYKSTIFSCFLK